MTCGCQIDWVLCFKADCPRAARIRAMQEAAWEVGRKLLGDPRVGVSFPVMGRSTAVNALGSDPSDSGSNPDAPTISEEDGDPERS